VYRPTFLLSSLCIGLVIILSIVRSSLLCCIHLAMFVVFKMACISYIYIFIVNEYGLLHVHENDKYNFQIFCLSFY
jgi:hypothetical protein